MILILTNDADESTNQVIDWLDHFDVEFVRINGEQFASYQHRFQADGNGSFYKLEPGPDNRGNVDSESVNTVWFRRWGPARLSLDTSRTAIGIQLTRHCLNEYAWLTNAFYLSLAHCPWLNHPNDLKIGKLYMLEQAAKAGLQIPDTIICTNKSDLLRFKQKYRRVITKSIGDATFFQDGGDSYAVYTHEITERDMDLLGDHYFFPSLLQQLVDKQFELRIFYLDEKFYSMAIFSQSSEQTKIDFRRYDYVKPNRRVPYRLPTDIERKLLQLMKNLKLTSASVDMIKGTDGGYFFLEANPIGQFGMVSIPCNYFLEEAIAENLVKKANGYA